MLTAWMFEASDRVNLSSGFEIATRYIREQVCSKIHISRYRCESLDVFWFIIEDAINIQLQL